MATCISCKGEYNEEHPEQCPRCGADNRNWHRHKNLGSLARFNNFFFGSVWGLLALNSLVLPLVPALRWGTFDKVTSMLIGVPLAILLCFIVLLFTHALKLSLREYEWLRRIKKGWNPPLSVVALVAFTLALILGLAVVFVLLDTEEKTRGLVRILLTIAFSLAFVNVTLSAMLMSIRDYAHRLDEEVPQPIFMHEDRLLGVIVRAAGKKLGKKLGGDTPLEAPERTASGDDQAAQGEAKGDRPGVQEWKRTASGGVRALLTFNSGLEERQVKTPEGEEVIIVQEEQQWEITADAWGHLVSLEEKGGKRLTQVK